MSAIRVIYAIRPNSGMKEDVREVFTRHVPALQAEGLITDQSALLIWGAKDGVFIESFEWKSADHSRRAETSSAIRAIWGEFARLGTFVPLAGLSETSKTFAHFEPV